MTYTTQAICPNCNRLHVSANGYDGYCHLCGIDASKVEECECCKTHDILDGDGLCRKCKMRYRDNGGCYER